MRLPRRLPSKDTSDEASPTALPADAWFAPNQRTTTAATAVRGAVWAGLLCGPAALLACWVTAGAPQPEKVPDSPPAEASALGPSGWAERAVGAYLDGDIEAVHAFFPTAPDAVLPDGPSPEQELRMSTVTAEEVSAGYWGVTVAVSVPRQDPHVPVARYYALGVVESDSGWVAAGLPSEIAMPTAGEPPELGYTSRPIAEGALTETVEHWARAYLTGEGELDRYLAPGFDQAPLAPAPYTGLELRSVVARDGQEEQIIGAPADGEVVDVLARIEAREGSEREVSLAYALELTARSGRWEVSTLRPAPLQAADSEPTSASD